jgi:hypothetical protein
LKLSLITNGLDLEKKSKEILGKFNWIRASVQSVKYAESINLKHVPSTVKTSMSYIVYDKKGIDEIKYLYQFSRDTNTIIRVGPKRPCTKSWEKTVENEVKSYGFPLLFFSKEAGSPAGCFMAYIRGAIDWKGNFLPCPSIELSPEFAGRIPNSFALCKISELEDWLINNPPHDLGYICSFCNCGKDTNDFIYNLLKNVEDEDFV